MHRVTSPFLLEKSWNFALWTRRWILNTQNVKAVRLLSARTANLQRKKKSVCTVTSCVMQKIIFFTEKNEKMMNDDC